MFFDTTRSANETRPGGSPASLRMGGGVAAVALALLLFLPLAAGASERSAQLLAAAWPDDSSAPLAELGRNVGIVFSPDLSVEGNCRFYDALGFSCYEDTDWLRVLDGIREHNRREPERAIRTLLLETHGTNGNGLKLQRNEEPFAERSYISIGALQERLAAAGVRFVILSACNSGRLMRPSIYNRLDPANGDRLFLPPTCGIVDASPDFDARQSPVVVLSPATSHIETTVAGSLRELSAPARRAVAAAAKAHHVVLPSGFAASDILCQLLLRDPQLELVAGAWVDTLSREHLSDEASDALFDRLLDLLDARAARARRTSPLAR
jgi:hypothetical protein